MNDPSICYKLIVAFPPLSVARLGSHELNSFVGGEFEFYFNKK
jgi:hypothetical protein